MAKCKRNRNRTKRSFTVKEPKANRNYKDTVFRMLFSDRKNLLSLYNAVNQTDYRNPEELEIVTLENAIYMGMKNDLTIAPYVENAEDNRLYFRKIKDLSVDIAAKNIDNVSMEILSMGMTGDYEVAIEEGATMVRVGTGIFGARNYNKQ